MTSGHPGNYTTLTDVTYPSGQKMEHTSNPQFQSKGWFTDLLHSCPFLLPGPP